MRYGYRSQCCAVQECIGTNTRDTVRYGYGSQCSAVRKCIIDASDITINNNVCKIIFIIIIQVYNLLSLYISVRECQRVCVVKKDNIDLFSAYIFIFTRTVSNWLKFETYTVVKPDQLNAVLPILVTL